MGGVGTRAIPRSRSTAPTYSGCSIMAARAFRSFCFGKFITTNRTGILADRFQQRESRFPITCTKGSSTARACSPLNSRKRMAVCRPTMNSFLHESNVEPAAPASGQPHGFQLRRGPVHQRLGRRFRHARPGRLWDDRAAVWVFFGRQDRRSCSRAWERSQLAGVNTHFNPTQLSRSPLRIWRRIRTTFSVSTRQIPAEKFGRRPRSNSARR